MLFTENTHNISYLKLLQSYCKVWFNTVLLVFVIFLIFIFQYYLTTQNITYTGFEVLHVFVKISFIANCLERRFGQHRSTSLTFKTDKQ